MSACDVGLCLNRQPLAQQPSSYNHSDIFDWLMLLTLNLYSAFGLWNFNSMHSMFGTVFMPGQPFYSDRQVQYDHIRNMLGGSQSCWGYTRRRTPNSVKALGTESNNNMQRYQFCWHPGWKDRIQFLPQCQHDALWHSTIEGGQRGKNLQRRKACSTGHVCHSFLHCPTPTFLTLLCKLRLLNALYYATS